MPKNVKGKTVRTFWNSSLLQNKRGPFGDIKFLKKSQNAEQKWKRGPFSLVRFRKCTTNFQGEAETRTSDHWVLSKLIKVYTKSGTFRWSSMVWQKTSHCNNQAHFSRKAPTKMPGNLPRWNKTFPNLELILYGPLFTDNKPKLKMVPKAKKYSLWVFHRIYSPKFQSLLDQKVLRFSFSGFFFGIKRLCSDLFNFPLEGPCFFFSYFQLGHYVPRA